MRFDSDMLPILGTFFDMFLQQISKPCDHRRLPKVLDIRIIFNFQLKSLKNAVNIFALHSSTK